MHAQEGVVGPRLQKGDAGVGQFGAEDQGEAAADQQQDEASDAILDANDLVVIVDAKVARPRRLAFGRPMAQRRVATTRPRDPVRHGADSQQEAHQGKDDAANPDRFRVPCLHSQQKAPRHHHRHADHQTDKVADEPTHQSERGKSHSLFLSFTHLLDNSGML